VESSRAALREQARAHYRRGNRFLAQGLFGFARTEWRQAQWIWRLAALPRAKPRRKLLDLRAVILLLLTVLLVFNLVYGIFPRGISDLPVAEDEEPGASWWDRWLDTGHPSAPGAPSVTLRDWWQRIQERWRAGGEEPAPEIDARPDLDERWEDLIARYRRPGNSAESLNYQIIAGFGFVRLGDYVRAATAFEAGLALAKQPRLRADLYQGLANAYYYQGYHPGSDGLASYDLPFVKKAADAYEQSAQAEPRALSIGNLGWMYFLLGDYVSAERDSLRALSLDKNLHYVRLNLGLTYLVQNRIEEAYEAYRTVMRSQPDDEMLSGGINDLREVIRHNRGELPYAELMLGLLARARGDLPRAENALRNFLRAPGTDARWRAMANQALRNINSPTGDL
jgi:tetratricopeptide (TPR) repeat protein